MKIYILLTITIFHCSFLNAQQIKELKYFYTDNINYYPSDLDLSRIYYKDINNYFAPFLGNWKYTNGNTTFIVTLWKETKKPSYNGQSDPIYYIDQIYGHYAMYQNFGLSTQTTLYTSQTNIGINPEIWDTVIFSDVVKPYELSGMILDIYATPLNAIEYPQGCSGYLSMKINTSSNPITATWYIGNAGALFGTNQPRNFTIPTNITLTKM